MAVTIAPSTTTAIAHTMPSRSVSSQNANANEDAKLRSERAKEKRARTSFDKYITGLKSQKLFGTRRKTNFDYFTADENEAEERSGRRKNHATIYITEWCKIKRNKMEIAMIMGKSKGAHKRSGREKNAKPTEASTLLGPVMNGTYQQRFWSLFGKENKKKKRRENPKNCWSLRKIQVQKHTNIPFRRRIIPEACTYAAHRPALSYTHNYAVPLRSAKLIQSPHQKN